MKKYTLVFIIFVLVLGAFAFNFKSTSAITEKEGCNGSSGYSFITGRPCAITIEPDLGCREGYRYSPLTGKPCRSILPEGCLPGYKYSFLSGVRCIPLPAPEIPSGPGPIVSSVKGPQKLNVGQSGTWTVSAYDKYGSDLSYSVIWGDEDYRMGATGAIGARDQQTATFTHSYSKAGTYNPTFYVSGTNNETTKTSLSVTVGGINSAQINVVSPNGGEAWVKGTNQTIKWSAPSSVRRVTITLDQLYDCNAGPGENCIDLYSTQVWKIENIRNNGSYKWYIPHAFADGRYIIRISDSANPALSDESNSYFKIGTVSRSEITVLYPNGGETLQYGKTHTVKWRDSRTSDCDLVGRVCAPSSYRYDISLIGKESCSGDVCGSVLYNVATGVYGSSYTGYLGNSPDSYNDEKDFAQPGSYKIRVCSSDGQCDTSDSYFKIAGRSEGPYDSFASCLKDKGAIFYGAFWCPHCQAQQALFGSSASLLPYMECSTPDGTGQVAKCAEKKITAYPTWKFADGSSLVGELTLKELSQRTSCALPRF